MMEFETIRLILEAEESSLLSPDQMGGYAVTALFTLINVVVAFLVIKKFIFKPILKMIKGREEALNNELTNAQNLNKEAAENQALSKQTIDDARVRAAAIIDEAKEAAEKQADIIVKKAHEDSAELLAQAESDAKRMKKVALEDMKDDLSDLAVMIAQRVLGDAVPETTLKELSKKHTEEIVEAEVNKLG